MLHKSQETFLEAWNGLQGPWSFQKNLVTAFGQPLGPRLYKVSASQQVEVATVFGFFWDSVSISTVAEPVFRKGVGAKGREIWRIEGALRKGSERADFGLFSWADVELFISQFWSE